MISSSVPLGKANVVADALSRKGMDTSSGMIG